MPLFMLISGYLFYFSFSKRELKEVIIHRSKPLLQSIVVGSIITYFVGAMIASFHGHFGALFDGGWIGSLGSLWFLWSVLASSIVVAVVCKKVKPLWLQILLLFCCIPIIMLFPNLEMNLFMYPYFIIGFYFAKYENNIPQCVKAFRYISLVCFPVLLFFFDKQHYIYTTGILGGKGIVDSLIIDLYRWVIGLIGSIFVITITERIVAFIKHRKSSILGNGILSCIGQKSLQMYVMSVALLSCVLPSVFSFLIDIIGVNFFALNSIVYNFVFTPILSFAYCIVLYLIICFLEGKRISKFIFGR